MENLTYVQVHNNGRVNIMLVETIFIKDIPHLVFRDEIDETVIHHVQLDPLFFHRNGGTSISDAHVYEIAVDDPRRSH